MVAFLIIVVYLIIAMCTASEFDNIAVMKGQPEKKYFWWCFWLGIAGWLMVVALPDHGGNKAIIETDELPDL